MSQIISGIASLFWNVLLLILRGMRATLRGTKWYVRHRPYSALAFVATFVILASVLVTGAKIYDRNLDAQIERELVEAIDKHATFKRNFNRENASKTGREFMRVGAPTWIREEGIRAIIIESRAAGLDNVETAVNLAIADRESGFNSLAKAKTTTACGLFQFIRRTGLTHGLSPSECMNPRANARAQVRHFREILGSSKEALRGLSGDERLVMMFKQAYCKHHDGINSSRCSGTASVVISNGLELLFASYKELEKADQRHRGNPGFAGEVADVLQGTYVTMRDITAPLLAQATSAISGNGGSGAQN